MFTATVTVDDEGIIRLMINNGIPRNIAVVREVTVEGEQLFRAETINTRDGVGFFDDKGKAAMWAAYNWRASTHVSVKTGIPILE